MAYIGLNYLVYKTDDGKNGKIAEPINVDININVNNQKLYAGDKLREIDNSFVSGTITAAIDDLDPQVYADLNGHAIADDEVVCATDDVAPYVGVGYYGSKRVGGVAKFRAIWHPRVKFSEPAEAIATKGESLTFQTGNIVGEILADDNKQWKIETTVATEEDAIAWLNAKAGITEA